MTKTKALIGILALTFAAFLSVYGCTKAAPKSSSVVLFSNPTNEAQKLANVIVAVGKTQRFNNVGSQDEGISYSHKLYIDSEIYEVKVLVYKNGQNSLHINHYLTNRSLEEMKTPADFVAQELMYGRSEIYIEEHISDYKVDMGVDIYQTFMKKKDGVYEGFTRAERDSKTSGVQEYLYHDGRELENGKRKVATKKIVDEIAKYYKELLAELLKSLEKN